MATVENIVAIRRPLYTRSELGLIKVEEGGHALRSDA